mgnify:CR=1 FL=1
MILITAYDGPDLDGAACAYAYAELLKKQGKDVRAAYFTHLRPEAEFAFQKVRATLEKAEEAFADEIILVDSCELKGISPKIDPLKVTEAIDHRLVHQAKEEFPNAHLQIERVGSCATLISEKFIDSKIKPSRESATLLFLAIASNTINFKNNVTTDRDIKAAEYLKSCYEIDQNLIHEMFAHQSKLTGTIREIFQRDKWSNHVAGKVFSIFQFEIIGVDEFIEENFDEIVRSLQEVIDEEKFDFAFATLVDLEKARNTFVVPNEKVGNLLGEILGVKFENNIAHYPKIIMRKEIMPKIKEYFEGHKS